MFCHMVHIVDSYKGSRLADGQKLEWIVAVETQTAKQSFFNTFDIITNFSLG